MQVLRTARDYREPPTAWVGGSGGWTPRDRAVTLAFTIYEGMLCNECGHPVSVCRDPKNAFEVTEDTCYARAAIDEHQKANAKNDPEPGQIISARLDDTPSVAVPPWLMG